jgi:hypothetical protein
MKVTESRHWEALEAQITTLKLLRSPETIQAIKDSWLGPQGQPWETTDTHQYTIAFADETPQQAADKTLQMMRIALRRAETYYWSSRICDIVGTVAPSMPTWTFTNTSLLSTHGWFYFAAPFAVPYVYEDQQDSPDPLGAISWLGVRGYDQPNGTITYTAVDTPDQVTTVYVTFYLRMKRHLYPITSTIVQHGEDLNSIDQIYMETLKARNDYNEISRQIHLWKMRHFAACLSFLEQKILTSEIHRIPRAVQRRNPELDEDTMVRTIYLRRISSRKPTEESQPVAWSHRWMVRGHWRQQWYAATQLHKPRWIHPFIKGPEDKPLKVPEKLFKVVR